MDFSVSTIAAGIALLISASATYNAYMLRGGKLALSQVLMALGMISLMFSLILIRFLPGTLLFGEVTVSDGLFVLGFLFLFIASIRLRTSFKV